jgi:hypothetical protein
MLSWFNTLIQQMSSPLETDSPSQGTLSKTDYTHIIIIIIIIIIIFLFY